MAIPRKKNKGGGGGAPAWVVTFADLMSLLLTFFVLILSFASVDEPKFKAAVGSIKGALGVQNDFIYKEQLSSRDPFKTEFKIKNTESIEKRKDPQLISAEANQFCELEEDRRAKDQEYLVDVANAVVEKFKYNSLVNKFFSFRVMDGAFKVSLDQSEMFSGSENFNRQASAALKSLFDGLPQDNFDVHITNYSPKAAKSQVSFNKWLKSNKRALSIAQMVQEIPSAKRHNFIVESRTQRVPTAIDKSEKIDLKFKFSKQ